VLESLFKYSHNPRQFTISNEYQSTFHWIWKREPDGGPGLLEWIESESALFWVAGKPGAGKSTLMKYVFNDDQTSTLLSNKDERIKKIGYWFHDLGEPNERTFLGFLRSFLYQLLKSFLELLQVILPIYLEVRNQSSKDDVTWNEIDTRRALNAISLQNIVFGRVCLFVDGLDECDTGAMRTEDIDFIVGLESGRPSQSRLAFRADPNSQSNCASTGFQNSPYRI